ncbi:hypothetical protein Fcan01_03176 [Folsomia candida]|uniref:Uncharacterized protein n=1 Tax=Folsomia candida TaxID=158441 RepID=A0A226EYH7_FOLCA|nr:hypothetical protein Fcan01_03176 [Folsomia candida]
MSGEVKEDTKSVNRTSSSSSGSVKILEGLSKTATTILKRNPSPHISKSGSRAREVDHISKRVGNMRRDDYSDEELINGGVISSNYNNNYGPVPPPPPIYPSPGPMPIFPNTEKPTIHYGNYGGGNNNYNMKPTVTSYYVPTGQSTLPPIIFPPEPGPTFPDTVEPGPVAPPPQPVGPPTPISPISTVVPIIGGGGGTGEEEDLLPPAPPEDIFPPSPPEIESVGRKLFNALPLKSNPPSVVRTRITPVGARVHTTSRERESGSHVVGSSPSRLRDGEHQSDNNKRVRVRLRDKVKESVESTSDERSVHQEDPNIITGATIHMKSGYHQPYVRDRPQDPLTSNECHMENVPGSDDVFHMTVTDLRGCGVETCGDYMCLTMVFPRVPADQRRSSSTVEGGGNDFAAEVGVFRQNPGSANGLFVKRVNSGGVVQLGEPLQMRSIVRGGDGWKHSKLSDVKVWRMRDTPGGNIDNLDPNDASEVITLVDSQGCRNDEYKVIADRHPLKDTRNDLINHFNFKAFLFRGQRANEPLVVTAKKSCGISRSKRSPVEITNASAIIHDWDSRMAIRVVGLKDQSSSLTEEDFSTEFNGNQGRSISSPMSCAEKMATAGLGGGLIVLLLCGIGMALYAFVVKGRSSKGVPPMSTSPPYLEHGQQHNIHAANQNFTSRSNPPMGFSRTNGLNPPNNNKPLPPLPTTQVTTENEVLSKSDITNVAKILQHFADKNNQSNGSEHTTYESIGKNSFDTSSGRDGGGTGGKNKLQRKKSDGVYIVYVDSNKNKSHRPRSAPPSLRGKNRKHKDKSKKKAVTEIFDSNSETPSQTEDPTEESDDFSHESSGSESSLGGDRVGKCVGFSGRKTVRNVKSRSSHHRNQKSQKVVKGIRRRLSSLYKDGKQGLGMIGGGGSKGGSFPTRWKAGSPQLPPPPTTDETTSASLHLSSDLDSAYYGSEFNDESFLREMRDLAYQHRKSRRYCESRPSHAQDGNNNNCSNLRRVQMQLQGQDDSNKVVGRSRIDFGRESPQLELGQTKAGHFVTRNDNSTQILIVPETHI